MADDTQVPADAGTEGLSHIPCDRGLLRLLAARHNELETCRLRFLGGRSDGEALHDLRVATRRLRSLLSGYRRYLQGGDALALQLRALQQESNPARDLEVFIALVKQCGPATSALIPPLQRQLDEHYLQLRDHLPESWQQLGPQLDVMAGMLLPDAPTKPLGKVCAREATHHYRRLKKGLKALQNNWDDRRAHRLRITGKRLRYLLEPFVGIKVVAQAITALKCFQDCLGDYHDSDLLQQRLAAWNPVPPLDEAQSSALDTLRTQLQGRHQQLRRDIRTGYLQEERKPFLRQLKGALRALVQ